MLSMTIQFVVGVNCSYIWKYENIYLYMKTFFSLIILSDYGLIRHVRNRPNLSSVRQTPTLPVSVSRWQLHSLYRISSEAFRHNMYFDEQT